MGHLSSSEVISIKGLRGDYKANCRFSKQTGEKLGAGMAGLPVIIFP
jgi:hypothetical protein